MTRPRSIVCGDGETAARVEYLKSRGVLRLTSGAASGGRELTVGAFCEALGIGPDAVAAPTYLLFAGRAATPAGGCRDLVATFLCPDEARREFTARRHDAGCTWAELVRLVSGRATTMCWFGIERADGPRRRSVSPSAPSRRQRWRRARRMPPQLSARA